MHWRRDLLLGGNISSQYGLTDETTVSCSAAASALRILYYPAAPRLLFLFSRIPETNPRGQWIHARVSPVP